MSATLTAPALAHGAMVDRILATFDACSDAEIAIGREWYVRAQCVARSISARYPNDPRVPDSRGVAGIIAALSPRTAWRTNVEWAREIVRARAHREACPPVGTGANRAKAWAIARGADPLDVLGGPKVRAFYRAICGDCDAVCVDIWAIRVACGTDLQPTEKQYRDIAAAYVAAAEQRGITPREMQATTWIHVRGSGE